MALAPINKVESAPANKVDLVPAVNRIPTVDFFSTEDTTPTITGTVGIEPLQTDESFQIMLDGKQYNRSASELAINGTSWTLQIPNALDTRKYNVEAERNFRDPVTKTVDTTTDELVISKASQPLTPVTPVIEQPVQPTSPVTEVNPPAVQENNLPTGNIIIDGVAQVGETLTANPAFSDSDGIDGITDNPISYFWFVSDDTNVTPVTEGDSYTITPEDEGKSISVVATYSDLLGNFETVASDFVTVGATSEELPTYTLSVDKTNANEGDTITLSLQTENVSADTEVKFDFGGSITSADTTAGLSSSSFFVGSNGTAKSTITFAKDRLTEGSENLTVTLQDDSSQSIAVSVKDTSVKTAAKNNSPTGSVTILGDAQVGQILTAENTLNDVDGLGEISYQWLRNGKTISGATDDNYTLVTSDLGKSISVKAGYTDLLKNVESVTSSATDLVKVIVPTYTLTADGTEVDEGGTVTFNLETTNLPKGSIVDFTFNGKISKDDVSGGFPDSQFSIDENGTASLVLGFIEDKLTEGLEDLTLTLNDDAEQNVSVSVNDTSITKIVNHKPTGEVKIQGTAKVGSALSITNTLKDADGLGDFSYQWLLAGKAISGATTETYTPIKSDIGKKISVNISYTDDLAFVESATSTETTDIKAAITINGLTKTGTSSNNKIVGAEKNDNLSGLAGADTLLGYAGDDLLDGGNGNDSIDAGNGNDMLLGGEGNDILLAGSGNDSLDGGKGDDKLTGDKGNDTLQGGVGADNMAGGVGDDYYFVDNKKDVVTEAKAAGTDTVESTSSYTLGANVENLNLAGILDNSGTGNELNNKITGNVGDNKLNGGAGNDTLVGGAGADELNGGLGKDALIGGNDDDIYYMNNTEDTITETATGGEKDEIIASVSFELSSSNVEILTLSGVKAINGTGDEFNNLIQEIDGGLVANNLNGKAGDDTINGEGGDDSIEGGEGNDVIDGGDGNDMVIFNGALEDYQIVANQDVSGSFTVLYTGDNPDINEGEDSLTNVEILEFNGDSYTIEELVLNGVIV